MSMTLGRKSTFLRLVAGFGAALLIGGCVVPSGEIYRWGKYEDVVYQNYKKPGSRSSANDAAILAEDMVYTESLGHQVPPGARIHLGYLYFSQGRTSEARAMFEKEKQIFPESAVFVDRLIARLGSR